MTNKIDEGQGVYIPQEAVVRSNEKKKSHRTLRQLPIYRDASNLKFIIASLYGSVPRKYTKYIDTSLLTACEAKKCVGLAESTRNAELRSEYLTTARVFAEDLIDDAVIMVRLGIISKETEKKMKAQARSVVAQCIAWRDYTNDQGASVIEN